jgi:hypothetical protein
MPDTTHILEYRSSKSPNVMPTFGKEQSLGRRRDQIRGQALEKTRVKLKTETMMRMKWMLTTFILMGMAALSCAAAKAQAGPPDNGQTGAKGRTAAVSSIQTDVGLSGFETFTSSTSGNGTQQTPTNSEGGMFEVRQILKPLLGYEMAYSYARANQKYAPKTGACALVCQNPTTSISASSSEISFNYVASYKAGNLRPFLVGGIGFYITIPGATPYGNNTSIRAVYDGGGGVDWSISQHLGIRLQVRDSFYKAPNISQIYPATGVFTSSLEPMGGVYYRF